ncbi:hypothetical protein N431DRAFT_325234 [Stipitochalara longipes BDJ]|nr:hypothetical protein N431DRAFT_325234 [Stipitochalara longipes BDJ]
MDKPLPPPPPPGSEPEPAPSAAKNPIKLDRIISPLSQADLFKIFSGAPQFFARSEGHHTGAPHPSVAFPWDSELHIRDLCDHVRIQDEAWGCVTAWPHITVQVNKNPEAKKEHCERQRAHFLPRCRERPNMLSMQGTERGTVGYQAALEIGVADALEIPDGGTPDVISEHRKKFLNGKDGLRPVTDSTLIDQLIAVSEIYQEDPLKHRRPTLQMYTELFTQILFPPSRVTDSDDPYSLQVQVESLVQVLAAPLIWVDFSLVEWRIRLGHILWGSSSDVLPEDEITVNDEVIHEPGTQKYWLLLQILLSCELLVRLDMISLNIDHGLAAVKPAEIRRFEQHATASVKWSMLLARAWLESIKIEKIHSENESTEKKPAGWLATLTGTAGAQTTINQGLNNVQFHGRRQAQQLAGLVHFAQKLGWPDLDGLKAKVTANTISISDSVASTPAGTPLTMATGRSSSYFARRPRIKRGLSSRKNVSAVIHPAGWLSNSYISGLILPGEGLSHFLISTLLENDDAAVARLGVEANLYGGFIYGEKSFWSTACIIGRVLAAGKGASECMGWISSNIQPRGAGEEWVNIDVEPAPRDDSTKKSSKPRLWHKTAIENDGSVLGGADMSSVLPGDFILPSDTSHQAPLSITFNSLDLFSTAESVHSGSVDEPSPLSDDMSEMPKIQTYSAMMRFTSIAEGEEKKEVNVSLTHDVYFVTAHPCIPSPHAEVLKTPTSPSFRAQSPSSISSNSPKFMGHPLHKAYTYTKLPLLSLLSLPTTTPFSNFLSPPPPTPQSYLLDSTTHTTSSTIPKVLVIDCTDSSMLHFPMRTGVSSETSSMGSATGSLAERGERERGRGKRGSDLEMLARAVCAERGWNALVSRRGRGCLACAVREAGALGWRVVLRVA